MQRDESFSLTEIISILKKQRLLILGFACGGIVLGSLSLLIITPRYSASATVISFSKSPFSSIVDDSGSKAQALAAVLSASGSTGNNPFFIAILKSTLVMDQVSKKTGLYKTLGSEDPRSARSILSKYTFLKEESGGIMRISFLNPNQEMAKAVVDEYIFALNDVLNSKSLTAAQRQTNFLDKRLQNAKKDLENAEANMTQFQILHKIISPEAQLNASIQLSTRLESALTEEQLKLNALTRSELVSSPEIIRVKDSIKGIEKQLKALYSTKVDGPKSNAASLQLLNSPGLLNEFAQLRRELEFKVAILELTLKEYEISRANVEREKVAVEVIDAPEVSDRPVTPNTRMVLALGFAGGLVLGFMFVLIRAIIFEERRLKVLYKDKSDLKVG